MASHFSSHLPLFMGVAVLMIAVGSSIALGGFRMGYLRRSIERELPKNAVEPFWEVAQRRLEELGFSKTETQGRYLQGSAPLGSPSGIAKELVIRFRESGPGELTVSIMFVYLRRIGADTGESAYRDAVLDYVIGKTDRMVIVPHRNLMALNSLGGGILACVLAIFVVVVKRWSFWPSLLVLTTLEIILGLLGLWAALYKPTEITGKSTAAAGICLSLAAMTITFFAMHADIASHGAH